MKPFPLLLFLLLPVFLLAQQTKNVYWVENNLQLSVKNDLNVINHNSDEFNGSSKNSRLTIKKRELDLSKDQMKGYLEDVLNNMGYSAAKEIKYQYKDFVALTYCQAEKEGYWGIFFLLKEELNGDNYFVGYLTTASKPTAENIRMIENFKVVEDGTLTMNDYAKAEEKPIERNSKIHDDLLELIKKYSPEIFKYVDYYYNLPSAIKGERLPPVDDIAEDYKDSIPYRSLYNDSWFIYSILYSLNFQLAVVEEIELAKENESKNYFSLLIDTGKLIAIEEFKTPPASIINSTYPSKFKGDNYKDCIFPSKISRNTQVNGIFGLTGEFFASCYQIKWYTDFLKYYCDNQLNNPPFYLEYLYQFPDAAYSTLLYKHYIIKYLSVIKDEMPDVYSSLLTTEDFRFILKASMTRFNQFTEEFNETKTKIRNELGNQYIPYVEDENKLLIDSLQYSNNSSLVLYNSLVNFIDQEQAYKEVLSDFGIPDGTEIIMIKE